MISRKNKAKFRFLPQVSLIALTAILALRLAAPLLSSAVTGHAAGLPAFGFDLSQPADASVLGRSERARRIRREDALRRRHESGGGGSREDRLASVIYGMQPRRGHEYAARVADMVMADARREHLSPEVIAATATVESHFDMRSGPCIGIMQVNPRTARERYSESGLSSHSIGGNLRMGASELARHYDEAGRGGRSERSRLAVMWGRYNGAGPHSGYVRRCMAAYHQILRDEG